MRGWSMSEVGHLVPIDCPANHIHVRLLPNRDPNSAAMQQVEGATSGREQSQQ
jgi:hypothetical protein